MLGLVAQWRYPARRPADLRPAIPPESRRPRGGSDVESCEYSPQGWSVQSFGSLPLYAPEEVDDVPSFLGGDEVAMSRHNRAAISDCPIDIAVTLLCKERKGQVWGRNKLDGNGAHPLCIGSMAMRTIDCKQTLPVLDGVSRGRHRIRKDCTHLLARHGALPPVSRNRPHWRAPWRLLCLDRWLVLHVSAPWETMRGADPDREDDDQQTDMSRLQHRPLPGAPPPPRPRGGSVMWTRCHPVRRRQRGRTDPGRSGDETQARCAVAGSGH